MTGAAIPVEGLRPIPPGIRCAGDYEGQAAEALPLATFEHLAGGSGDDLTARRNLEAFGRLSITPRVLRDLAGAHTRTALPDGERPHPIFLAPVAHQGLFHPRGELETARGAAAAQAGLVCSTLSSHTLEAVAAAAGPDRWFQLYLQPDRAVTLDLVRRAEAAGYRALILTVDAPVRTPSRRAERAGFEPVVAAANLQAYPSPAAPAAARGESRIFQGLMRAAPRWDDLDWLASQTSLPVWIKGVMHPEDAAEAFARGAVGVVVSNHGGRSLDGAPASLAALPRIRAALGEAAPLLFDGGIRSGADVFKAIALGADGVLVGRLQAWALATAGALGVGHMIKLLREELELCMALAGCETLADIRKADVLGAEGSAPC